MNENNLNEAPKKEEPRVPKAIRQIVSEKGAENERIVAAAATDMNEACQYADGFIVLTEKHFFVLAAESESKEPRNFKGYLSIKDMERERDCDWKCTVFENDSIKKLKIEPQVAISLLIMEDENGIERVACVFSNLHRRKMHKFVREFDRLPGREEKFPEGEEGTPGREKHKLPIGGHGPGGPRGFGGHGGPGGPENEEDEYCPICGMMYPNKDRKVCPRCIDRKTIFVRTFKYFARYKALMALMVLMYLLVALLNLVWPYLNGTVLYDYVLTKNEDFLRSIGIKNGDFVLALFFVILTMFMARLMGQLLTILQGVFTARIVSRVVCDMKKDIFNVMGKLSISFFKSRQTGSLMTRVLSDAERVAGFFIDQVPYIFIHAFTLITTFAVMFKINWKMALVALVLEPIAFIFSFYIRPRFWNAFGKRHRAERSINSQVNDNLTGARVVKAFGQEENEENRFVGTNKRLKDAEMSIVGLENYNTLVFSFAHGGAGILIWALGAFFILGRHTMALGVLITFTGYVSQLDGPMRFASWIFRAWADSMNAAQRMFEIIDAVPEVTEAENPVPLEKVEGSIELKNVTFGYEVNRPVLKNINLTIPAGSMLGIVGRSGAGKTTLVNLISRMYDPEEGSILIDGIDIKELAFRDLRRNVAMVSQETYIFMGTVEENIAYANSSATKQEIIRAAKLASAHEFIMRLPDGYNTVVGASGRELSGGERQRISIARAILADPKILILDEATASVDTETERAIQTSINYLVKGRTTISIAHRLSTLRDADFLCVLDNGEITERGTHEELKDLKGTYFKLMELQTKALALRE